MRIPGDARNPSLKRLDNRCFLKALLQCLIACARSVPLQVKTDSALEKFLRAVADNQLLIPEDASELMAEIKAELQLDRQSALFDANQAFTVHFLEHNLCLNQFQIMQLQTIITVCQRCQGESVSPAQMSTQPSLNVLGHSNLQAGVKAYFSEELV